MLPKLAHIHALIVLLSRVWIPPLLDPNSGNRWKLQDTHVQGLCKNAEDNKEMFVRECVQAFPVHSREEAVNIYREIRQFVGLPHERYGIFSLLLDVAKGFLHMDGGNILVRHELMVQWREEFHAIGQSPFLCAFLAWEDRFADSNGRRCDFSPYAKSDNLRLRQILSQGVAENHFHLKGSAPAFLTSWVCLMNHMENRKNHFRDFHKRIRLANDPLADTQRQDGGTIHDLVLQAAAIRLFFFRLLNENPDAAARVSPTHPQPLDYCRVNQERLPLDTFCECNIDGRIESWEQARYRELRQNLKLPRVFASRCQREANAFRSVLCPDSLDYMADTSQMDSPYGPLAGEHTFLYLVFKQIYQGNSRFLKYMDLFYAYLLIFIHLRRELVQVNNTVGFDNFFSYQDRKELFLEGYPAYKDALIEMAYGSALGYRPLRSLEARVVPKKTIASLHREHIRLERLAAKGDARLCRARAGSLPGQQKDAQVTSERSSCNDGRVCRYFDLRRRQCGRGKGPCDQALSRVFHVLHFVKNPEAKIDWTDPAQMAKAIGHWRHAELRNEVEKTASAILGWRDSGIQQATRVYGIDACNNEISCRPEIFAPAFRRLKAHCPSPVHERMHGNLLPSLRITFHAGEDFLDVVDGLRAIDEAYHFLGLRHGDRLGHALALGVDAPEWYAGKRNKVVLSKQDRLDNIAWFYCRLRHRGLCTEELAHRLQAEYEELFASIYGGSAIVNGRVPIEIYYEAWKLRGDHPKHYRNLQGKIPDSLPAQFSHEFQGGQQLRSLRKSNLDVVNLVHLYHYSPAVKESGEQIAEFEVFSTYVEAVAKLQAVMRQELSFKGIGIETNPSSNYLIGTFRKYAEHPIVRFYDHGLRAPGEAEQLLVSINTDDQGVFDTDLENEYVLMACALETAKDSQGKPRFKPANVYQWIDNVRRMGLEQSFRNLSDSLGGSTDV